MPKTNVPAKGKEKLQKQCDDGAKLAELATSDDYQKYIKEHARRLRQLEREASGWNMVEP